MSRTLMIMKPDVLKRGLAGKVLAMVEEAGFTVCRMELTQLTPERAKAFYAVHADKPFIGELVDYMTSGPCVPIILEREDAITTARKLMGATNPKDAEAGTIRANYGVDIQTNSVHGSDSPESAGIEIPFFFPDESGA